MTYLAMGLHFPEALTAGRECVHFPSRAWEMLRQRARLRCSRDAVGHASLLTTAGAGESRGGDFGSRNRISPLIPRSPLAGPARHSSSPKKKKKKKNGSRERAGQPARLLWCSSAKVLTKSLPPNSACIVGVVTVRKAIGWAIPLVGSSVGHEA